MRLDWLELVEFRSYSQLSFRPDDELNVLIGENGAGKTNLLEAIGYLSVLSSFRHAPDEALIALGAETAVLRGEVQGSVSRHRIEVLLGRSERRRVQLDGKRPRRNAELRTALRVVTFLPDDLELVKGSAGRRRTFLDDLAAQLHPAATADQGELERALRQRNTLLRQHRRNADPDALAGFEGQIAVAGARVLIHRRAAIAGLGPYLEEAYHAFGSEDVSWVYESRWAPITADEPAAAAALLDALERTRSQDMDRGTTTVGPQRDNPVLRLDERDSRTHASQGEQRSLVLSLRLATFDLISDTFDDRPVIVLDDVFSELDPRRAQAVLGRLPGAQTFVSSARGDDVVPTGGARWLVEATGMVSSL